MKFEEVIKKRFYGYHHGMLEFKNKLKDKSLHYLQVYENELKDRHSLLKKSIKSEAEYYKRRHGTAQPALGLQLHREDLRALKRKLFVVKWLIKEKRGHTPESKQPAVTELKRLLR